MLKKHFLFRVVYRQKAKEFFVGNRKTVVADELQEAIDRVREHENVEIEITEVTRENIEVWS